MLKIKDNVDLKELEKFGFKPRYNSDTGNILYYYKDYFTEYMLSTGEYRHYRIILDPEKVKVESGGWLKKKVIKSNFSYYKPQIYNKVFDMFVDTLYDLIQAGLVEKVGGESE